MTAREKRLKRAWRAGLTEVYRRGYQPPAPTGHGDRQPQAGQLNRAARRARCGLCGLKHLRDADRCRDELGTHVPPGDPADTPTVEISTLDLEGTA